jgi:hypothetical protein
VPPFLVVQCGYFGGAYGKPWNALFADLTRQLRITVKGQNLPNEGYTKGREMAILARIFTVIGRSALQVAEGGPLVNLGSIISY